MLTGSYSWPSRRLLAIHHTSGRMPLGEADTRSKLIDPALHARGWTEDLIRREETAGAVEVVGERARYEQPMGFSLEPQAARPLLARYPGGEATRRYSQDAAIRAVLVRRAGKSAPRALRLQVHRGGRRCRLFRRPPRRGPPPLHRHHGGPPHDGRGRPLRPEHRLLQTKERLFAA